MMLPKPFTLGLMALALTFTTAGAVAAKERASGADFDQLDLNSDGEITAAEITQRATNRFVAADTDDDGMLSRDELTAHVQNMRDERVARHVDRVLERRDENGDGALTQAELGDGRLDRMMARADEDGDGVISRAEFDAARHHRGRHGGGPARN